MPCFLSPFSLFHLCLFIYFFHGCVLLDNEIWMISFVCLAGRHLLDEM